MIDFEEPDENLPRLIENITRRPWAYITGTEQNGTPFSEVAAFVNGFAYGRGGATLEQMSEFRNWIAYRCWRKRKLPQNYTWQWYMQHLYPEIENPLIQFHDLFQQFLTETNGER